MIHRWLAGLGCTVLTIASACAADVPFPRYMPQAPTYVPVFSWTGVYAGVNAGYGFGQSTWTDTGTGIGTGDFDASGAVAGGTLGYNVQMGPAILGIEADFDWTNINGSNSTVCGTACETSSPWLGTGRGRIGYAMDRFLPYLTGGVAFGNVKGSFAGIASGSFASTQIGWTAGAGLEYAFADSWSVKVEYLYVDLGTATCDAACSGGTPFDVTFTTSLVRGGINFRF